MSAIAFDTLKLARKLEASGFTAQQAAGAAEALAETAAGAEVVTKEHLDHRLIELEQRLTIRLGGLLVVAVGVILAAIRYLPNPPPGH